MYMNYEKTFVMQYRNKLTLYQQVWVFYKDSSVTTNNDVKWNNVKT